MWNSINNTESNYFCPQSIPSNNLKKEKYQFGEALTSVSKNCEIKQLKGESSIRCKICNNDSSCIHRASK
jgi:hypothetical protein